MPTHPGPVGVPTKRPVAARERLRGKYGQLRLVVESEAPDELDVRSRVRQAGLILRGNGGG